MPLRFGPCVQAALLLISGMLLCVPTVSAQEPPEIEGTVTISTDAGESETLTFGLDPDATSGVDSQFGELERPPVPPGEVFDVRWVDDNIDPSSFGEGLHVDIRQGGASSNGTRQHELQFQAGDTATEVTIEWNLPTGVTGTIEVGDGPADMEGSGSVEVDPSVSPSLLTIDYNVPPTLDTNAGTTLDEGGQAALSADSLSASDPDHDPSSLTFTVTSGPTEGILRVEGTAAAEFTQQDLIDGNVTYDHTAGIAPGDVPPDDSFTFDLQDGKGEGPTGNVFSVAVRPANDPPTATSDTDTTQEGTPISAPAPGLLENDSDPNGDALSVSAVNGTDANVGQQITLPSGALLTVEADGAYTYDPNGAFDDLGAGDTGSDSFTYATGDGNGGTGQASVSLTIEGPSNGAPTATADSFSAHEDSTLTVDAPGILGNDSDPDGDLLTPTVVAPPDNGTVMLSEDGSFEYVPDANFDGTDSFTYEVTDGNGAADQAIVTLEVNGTRMLSLESGWNLVSIPYQMEDQTFGSLLPSCTSGFFFDSDSGTNQPISDGDPLPVGKGFWARCPSGTVEVAGQRAASQTVSVAAGWNLIGPRSDSVGVESISSDPSGITVSSVYSFSHSGGYTPVSTLAPGSGHWINVSQSGTLTLGGGSGKSSFASGPRQQSVGEDGKPVSIRVTDSQGREATLRLQSSSSPVGKQGYELPPVPPEGTFDIRFANGASLAVMEAGAGDSPFRDVRLQGVEYPLTLRLQGASSSHSVEVRQSQEPETEAVTLTSTNPSVTLQDRTGQLQVGLEEIPERFSLQRSVPNPVSEQATITFSVPEQTRVRIDVFDVLGRRITTLTEGERKAGQHETRLNVRSLSSGTYFYRMSAGGFSITRRLNVVQ